jgi:hypothetical protein
MAGEPFHAPGGRYVPLAAAVIMVWLLTTLEWIELGATAGLVIVSGVVYGIIGRIRAMRRENDQGPKN